MQTAAVLPTLGIGDALLMMIASQQLKLGGYCVTTFHHSLPELSSWFPGHELRSSSDSLDSFDLILVENDNSPKIKQLLSQYRSKLSIFYPTYSPSKHAPLSPQDRVFNEELPMADNVARSIASLLYCVRMENKNFDSARQSQIEAQWSERGEHSRMAMSDEEDRSGKVAASQNFYFSSEYSISLVSASKANGISPPVGLAHRSNKTQVVIHPTSRIPAKNWRPQGFFEVARKLKEKGFHPLFCVAPMEQQAWKIVEAQGFPLAQLSTLADLAKTLHKSGFVIGNDSLIGHLGSNLGIPTLIIANDEKRMRLWRPGWHPGRLVLPPSYLPNWKYIRLHWQQFIRPRDVLKSFDELVHTATADAVCV